MKPIFKYCLSLEGVFTSRNPSLEDAHVYLWIVEFLAIRLESRIASICQNLENEDP